MLRQRPLRLLPKLQPYGLCRHFSFKHDLLDDLGQRGLIADTTKPGALRIHLKERQVMYTGIDPTASALHVGHLVPLMCMLHFHLRGHDVISLIGGATGMVGDPTGRATERTPISSEEMETNQALLAQGVQRFFESAEKYAENRLPPSEKAIRPVQILNNKTWTKDLTLLDFLRDVGLRARVNTMLARDSVQSRLTSSTGMSFTEFTYQLLQAHDFYHMNKTMNCSVQLGGSDQWGNIVAGLDLIHYGGGSEDAGTSAVKQRAYGITTPLLTTAKGEKFGKSAGNAVWLNDCDQTGELDFYQFWLRTTDADVVKYLRMFTLLDPEEIEAEVQLHSTAPHKRHAQRLLASEVMAMVRGPQALKRAQSATRVIYDSDLDDINPDELIEALRGDPRLVLADVSAITPKPLCKLAVEHGLVPSRAVAARLVNSGGFYLNNLRINDVRGELKQKNLIKGRVAVIRAGRGNHLILATHQDVRQK